ncbi:MAG: hypothetical protein FWH36_02785 [Lentimicrobiaceae bacterium]|nr:hypothetical protein [Lentimicrobiaceae bacterium]
MKFKTVIILLLLFFGSCTTTKWCGKRLPERLWHIEDELKTNLGIRMNRCYSMRIRPLITKENDIGIYSYGIKGIHYSFRVFMYDGDTVFYTMPNDSLSMKKFIDSNQFSRLKGQKGG